MQSMEQKRAAHAWDKAKIGVGKHQSDYVNDAKGLPALIMNSGLMQVMAFLESKQGRHALLGEHLRDWLAQSNKTPKDFTGFMQYLMNAKAVDYQAIASESFAWLRWLRQVAPAINKGE